MWIGTQKHFWKVLVESLMTQTLVLFGIRTAKNPLRSRSVSNLQNALRNIKTTLEGKQ